MGSALGVSALGLVALWSLNFEARVRVAVTLALGALLGAVAMAVVIAIGYSCSY